MKIKKTDWWLKHSKDTAENTEKENKNRAYKILSVSGRNGQGALG